MNKTATLADRLRSLADELESAERYGLPLPAMVSTSSHNHTHVSFHTDDRDLFDQWADYTEAEVVDYDYADHHWSRATADVNGLIVQFATARPILTAVTA